CTLNLRLAIDGRSIEDQSRHWIERIVFDDTKDTSGTQHSPRLSRHHWTITHGDMVIDADSRNKIERSGFKPKDVYRHLMPDTQIAAGLEHALRRVATHR